jgi:hypothetical protein
MTGHGTVPLGMGAVPLAPILVADDLVEPLEGPG